MQAKKIMKTQATTRVEAIEVKAVEVSIKSRQGQVLKGWTEPGGEHMRPLRLRQWR